MNKVSKISNDMRRKIDRAIQRQIKLNHKDWEEIIDGASTQDIEEILNAIGKRIKHSKIEHKSNK